MKNRIITLAALSVLALSTAACASTTAPVSPVLNAQGQAPVVVGTRPTLNSSPMDPAMQCFAQATRQSVVPNRIAVGQIRDYTGKFSNEASEGGFRITQGGSLMVMSALGKLDGIEQVERFDMDIASNEATLTQNQLIQDPAYDPANPQAATLRRLNLTAGQYQGSDYYIVGGITEVNYDIVSGGAELGVSLFEAGMRYYVINTAVDLRLVDTKSLKVVKTVSVQKQIIGYETRAGLFRFFGDYLVDINTGKQGQEPLQLGVRATLEYATLELLNPLYGNYFRDCAPLVDASFRS
ncbi:hypothetical protein PAPPERLAPAPP_03290 [Brevundimonas phage vB_BpoS-Papperlapapp]|uniref:Uncharacterized protein n=1 Tax=Brevundimonas phage vB_BpoS-Domovoi TaxID=2948598 RepID=A0A9E7MQW4_9CAUD|nr:hypothetical protein DOMOVOI_02240 [Brevundimonas phage vB_BpoS-Domovoi]USN16070.1 hypothetical protein PAPPERLAPAPP_03290 [Brevundimonas phage vB_BpoS-Papperlapapp]